MKKIALEEHFLAPDFIKAAEEDFAAFNSTDVEFFRKKLLDLDAERLKAMDEAGIEIAVLSLTDPGVQREKDRIHAIKLAQQANDFLMHQIQKHPMRFRGFAHLPLQDPLAAAEELERCVRDMQFVGALINGQTNGHYLDEEQYYPFWEKAQELDVPIYLHPGNFYQLPHNLTDHQELAGALWGWTVETATHALRLIVSGLFDRFPKAKLILGHMGETLPFLLWRFDSRWKIIGQKKTLKKAPSQYVKDNIFITTSGMCANEPLLCAIQALGEDRIMFSVDYPYESSIIASNFIEQAPLDDNLKKKICYQNAAKLLKI